MSRPRVLLIAEAANPDWTSVPLVGWSLARALMDVVDGHLVTQTRNREAILAAGLREGRDFTVIDSEPVAKPLWRASSLVRRLTGLGWTFETAMQALPYYYFERALWRRFAGQVRAGDYQIVHRITPLSPTIPSVIAGRVEDAGARFVVGPLNGGVPWPPGFADVQRREGEWLHYVRDAYKLLPGYHQTRERASAILAASRATYEQLPNDCRARAVYIPENAVDPARFEACVEGPVRRPLRVAFVGRLVPYKGADMLLEAGLELMKAGKLEVDIIGDGPERERLEAMVDAHQLRHAVHIDGWVEHRQLAARLVQSDVFGFPSVREFGGGVVLEAMALGLVPVIADYAGPAELVTDDTGYRVPIAPRDQLVRGFREVLTRLAASPEGLREMGQRARARVLRWFTWQAKAQQTLEVYRWVLGEGPKPDFGMPFRDAGGGCGLKAPAPS